MPSPFPMVQVSGGGSGGTPAEQREALGVLSDAMDGTDWTSLAASSGETTVWADSLLTLSVPAATPSNEHSGAYNASALEDPDSYDVVVRLRFVSGDGDVNARFHVRCGKNANNHVLFSLAADGSAIIGRTSGGSYGGAYVSPGSDTIGSADRTSGDLYLRVSRRPTGISVSWGAAASGMPTSWGTLYSGVGSVTFDALDLSSGSWVLLGANAGSGVADGLTVEVSEIRRCSGGLAL